jgi:very-short-patch-repair endonuclease
MRGLPEPEINAPIAGLTVDFLWRKHGLAVETDSYEFHKAKRAFEADRRRDTVLQKLQIRPIRVTDARLTYETDAVVDDVEALLRIASAPADP